MPKLTFSALITLMGLISFVPYSSAASPQPTVQLKTEPPIEKIVPSGQPVKFTLQALDAQGKRLKDAKISLSILTPRKTHWLTTDFPIVEGTQLLELAEIAPTGELEVQQVLPIRGKYQLLVNVTPLKGQEFVPTQQTFTISVPESQDKYRNFVILAVILLLLGLAGGWVIGAKEKTQVGEIAPPKVRLLLSGATLVAIATLLTVNISAELAESHHHQHSSQQGEAAASTAPALQVRWLGDVHATVGQLAEMGVQLNDPNTGQMAKDAVIKVRAIGLEHNETVFAYQGVPDSTGKLTWKQQFFDGAPHKIEVEVAPQANASRQFQPFTRSQDVEVDGIAPPLYIRLISLGYFTGILVLGLLLGLFLKRSRLVPTPKVGF